MKKIFTVLLFVLLISGCSSVYASSDEKVEDVNYLVDNNHILSEDAKEVVMTNITSINEKVACYVVIDSFENIEESGEEILKNTKEGISLAFDKEKKAFYISTKGAETVGLFSQSVLTEISNKMIKLCEKQEYSESITYFIDQINDVLAESTPTEE